MTRKHVGDEITPELTFGLKYEGGVGQGHRWMQLTLSLAFFDKHTRTSASLQQLGENIHRAASRLPSAQAAGVRIPGAERESDPPRGL